MSDWKKEVVEGENHYVKDRFRIEPVSGNSYYKWFLFGSPGKQNSFHTLKQAKEYADGTPRLPFYEGVAWICSSTLKR